MNGIKKKDRGRDPNIIKGLSSSRDGSTEEKRELDSERDRLRGNEGAGGGRRLPRNDRNERVIGEGPHMERTGGKGDKEDDKGIGSYKPEKRDEQASHQGGLLWAPTNEQAGGEKYPEV